MMLSATGFSPSRVQTPITYFLEVQHSGRVEKLIKSIEAREEQYETQSKSNERTLTLT